MSDHPDDDDYEVGYRKPPKPSQWRKGVSGNPNGGSRKGAKTLGQELVKEGNRRRRFEYDGKKYDMTQREINARLLYQEATSNDADPKAFPAILRAFSTIFKLEGEELDRMIAATAPSGEEPEFECVLVDRTWASHCPVCHKARYDEIERERKQFLESGWKMQAIRYSGPPRNAEQIEEFELYRKRADLELAPYSTSENARGGERRKRPKRRNMSYSELLILEGNKGRRVLVEGKMVSKSLREIAAMNLYARSFGRDSRVITLIARFEAQERRRSAFMADFPNLSEDDPEPNWVTLVFPEEPEDGSCDACKRAFHEKRLREGEPNFFT